MASAPSLAGRVCACKRAHDTLWADEAESLLLWLPDSLMRTLGHNHVALVACHGIHSQPHRKGKGSGHACSVTVSFLAAVGDGLHLTFGLNGAEAMISEVSHQDSPLLFNGNAVGVPELGCTWAFGTGLYMGLGNRTVCVRDLFARSW